MFVLGWGFRGRRIERHHVRLDQIERALKTPIPPSLPTFLSFFHAMLFPFPLPFFPLSSFAANGLVSAVSPPPRHPTILLRYGLERGPFMFVIDLM